MAKKRKVKRVVAGESEGKSLSFEEALGQLEQIVGQLESGKLPLAEALEQYELGVRHLKTCYQLLERAERRIELLNRVDEEGNPEVEPFDESATLRPDGRKRRGSRQIDRLPRAETAGEGEMDDSPQLF